MQLQASGCYYHPGRLAVATCAKCGVGICRECAVKTPQGTILCYKCGNKQLKLEHKEYRKHLKESGGRFKNATEFIIPGIIGVIIAVAGVVATHYGFISFQGVKNIFFLYFLFSIPFGYVVLSDLLSPKYDTIWNNVTNFYIKIMCSFMIGWIVFPLVLIRFIIRKIIV